MDQLNAILRSNDLVAVIGRDVPVRLVNISGSGCLLQAESRIAGGTTGSLRVSFDGHEYSDDVRVVRCREMSGAGGRWQFGVEFLWTTQPNEQSLRRVIPTLHASAVKADSFRTSERV